MAVQRESMRSLRPTTEMGVSDVISRKESPPHDDVCPVCFGDFVLPCRADCGHWFCGSCILQVWNFSSALRACKCPMCVRPIRSFKLFVSLQQPDDEEEAKKVLKSIERYNRLFVGGTRGFVLKLYDAPLFLRRLFREMTDPNHVHRHVHSWRLLAIMLGYLYVISPFDFIPESVNIANLCNISAMVVVLLIMIIGVFQRRRAAERVRRLASETDQ